MPRFSESIPATFLDTEEQLEALREVIKKIKLVSFDTETTGLDTYLDRPILMSISFPRFSWEEIGLTHLQNVFPSIWDPEVGTGIVFEVSTPGSDAIVEEMESCDVIAHNWKFDAHMCYRTWGKVPGINGVVYDTQHMDWLANENRPHGLKECCEDYGICFGMTPFKKLFKNPPAAIKRVMPELSATEYALMREETRDMLLEYAALDAYATLDLFYYLKEKLEREVWPSSHTPSGENKTLFDLYVDFESPMIKGVWIMESNGAYCDPLRLEEYREPIQNKLQEAQEFYATLAGAPVNLNSTDQLISLLFDQLGLPIVSWTSGGKKGIKKPSLDAAALEELNKTYPGIVSELIEYRKLGKLYSTYIVGLKKHIREDGRIYGSFNTIGTATGRLSSSSPNLQNISNKNPDPTTAPYDIRKAFCAPEGSKLLVADYDTLEICITAHVSKDENLIRALKEGLDQHSYTAHLMFGVDYDELLEAKSAETPTGQQEKLLSYRKAAKTITFGILYGMGAHKLSHDIEVSLEEAEEYIERFFQAYPGVREAKNYWTEFCKVNGYVLTILGRRRRLPEINSRRFRDVKRAERQAFNAVIQGSAADLMRHYIPALAFDKRLRDLGAKLVLQIHDEVVVEAPEAVSDEVKSIVDEILSDALSYVGWEVPLSASANIANSWSEGK